MTPILLQFFADPANHNILVTFEPTLCYALMSISTSMFTYPLAGPSSNHQFLHVKCWSITQRLIQRILWAGEHGADSRLRTLGSVLALMLLAEWPPRAIQMSTDEMLDAVMIDVGHTQTKSFPTLEDEERHVRISNGEFQAQHRHIRRLISASSKSVDGES